MERTKKQPLALAHLGRTLRSLRGCFWTVRVSRSPRHRTISLAATQMTHSYLIHLSLLLVGELLLNEKSPSSSYFCLVVVQSSRTDLSDVTKGTGASFPPLPGHWQHCQLHLHTAIGDQFCFLPTSKHVKGPTKFCLQVLHMVTPNMGLNTHRVLLFFSQINRLNV